MKRRLHHPWVERDLLGKEAQNNAMMSPENRSALVTKEACCGRFISFTGIRRGWARAQHGASQPASLEMSSDCILI